MFTFSKRSLARLETVHPDLQQVVHLAIQRTRVDFAVISGRRTLEEQKALVATGRSQTLNSRHLTGHAVDVVPIINGKASWDPKDFAPVADAMLQASEKLAIPVFWGGHWSDFKDYPHFELFRSLYA